MKLRKANNNDINRCLELLSEDDFRYCNGDFPEFGFISEFLNEYFYVLEEDSEILGCYLAAKIFSSGVYLWYMVVDKKHRNKNFGSYILKETEKIHKAEGKNWIYFISPLQNIDFYTSRNYLPHHTQCKEFFKEI